VAQGRRDARLDRVRPLRGRPQDRLGCDDDEARSTR
jgi:hypothetical protein